MASHSSIGSRETKHVVLRFDIAARGAFRERKEKIETDRRVGRRYAPKQEERKTTQRCPTRKTHAEPEARSGSRVARSQTCEIEKSQIEKICTTQRNREFQPNRDFHLIWIQNRSTQKVKRVKLEIQRHVRGQTTLGVP